MNIFSAINTYTTQIVTVLLIMYQQMGTQLEDVKIEFHITVGSVVFCKENFNDSHYLHSFLNKL